MENKKIEGEKDSVVALLEYFFAAQIPPREIIEHVMTLLATQRAFLLKEIEGRIEAGKRPPAKGEGKVWAAHYLGMNEAKDEDISIIKSYL